MSEFRLIFFKKRIKKKDVWNLLFLQIIKWGLPIRLYKLKERGFDSFNRAGGLKN